MAPSKRVKICVLMTSEWTAEIEPAVANEGEGISFFYTLFVIFKYGLGFRACRVVVYRLIILPLRLEEYKSTLYSSTLIILSIINWFQRRAWSTLTSIVCE